MPPKSVLPTPSEQKRLLDKAKEMMRESQEQAADNDSRHVLLSRSLVSTKPFGKKRRRRGKAVWFIEDKYVNQHNVIKIDKGSKDGKVWVKAAKRFSRPLRCSECGRGPYAKLEGQEGHKMQSCLEADREHKKQYDAQKQSGNEVNPFTLSQRKAKAQSPLRTKIPSETNPEAQTVDTLEGSTRWLWCHPNSDRDKTKKFREELLSSAVPFQEQLKESYKTRSQGRPVAPPLFYQRNFIVTPSILEDPRKHKPISIILWYPELFWAKKKGFKYQQCPYCNGDLIAKKYVQRLVEDFAGTHVLCAKGLKRLCISESPPCGPRRNPRHRSSRCFS